MNSLTRTENQALARTVLELDVNNHRSGQGLASLQRLRCPGSKRTIDRPSAVFFGCAFQAWP
jgi:hypothetical protein